jgi:hypothetical protein
MVQLISASALIEVIVCDGIGGGGDGHIRTAAAGGTATDLRKKQKQKILILTTAQEITTERQWLWFTSGGRTCGCSGGGVCRVHNNRVGRESSLSQVGRRPKTRLW